MCLKKMIFSVLVILHSCITLCVSFQFQLGACEDRRQCVQCQAWKTGERKDEEECKKCPFKITMVEELKQCKANGEANLQKSSRLVMLVMS